MQAFKVMDAPGGLLGIVYESKNSFRDRSMEAAS